MSARASDVDFESPINILDPLNFDQKFFVQVDKKLNEIFGSSFLNFFHLKYTFKQYLGILATTPINLNMHQTR